MEYVLKRYRRSRGVRIRVDHDGQVVVSAPVLAPKKWIDGVVAKNLKWIERQLAKLSLAEKYLPVIDWQEGWVSYLGELYPLRVDRQRPVLVQIEGRVMWVNPPVEGEKMLKATVLGWLKQEGRREISRRVKQWSERMQVTYTGIRFAQQKSRWGSCSGQGGLSFNWRLVHFPPAVIDYVVIHELAHLTHHNHSPAFWREVARYDSKYKERVKYLKGKRVRLEKV